MNKLINLMVNASRFAFFLQNDLTVIADNIWQWIPFMVLAVRLVLKAAHAGTGKSWMRTADRPAGEAEISASMQDSQIKEAFIIMKKSKTSTKSDKQNERYKNEHKNNRINIKNNRINININININIDKASRFAFYFFLQNDPTVITNIWQWILFILEILGV